VFLLPRHVLPEEVEASGLPPYEDGPGQQKGFHHRAANAMGPGLQKRLQASIEVEVLEAEQLQGAASLGTNAQTLSEALHLFRNHRLDQPSSYRRRIGELPSRRSRRAGRSWLKVQRRKRPGL